uniref:Carboxypeptidase inhibitor n=1 Tax=Rhipicephalus zambeziensis TaxID=60191 RepID=A0A224Y2P8_9ACAR
MKHAAYISLVLASGAALVFVRVYAFTGMTKCDKIGFGCISYSNCPTKKSLGTYGCGGFRICCQLATLNKCKYKGGTCQKTCNKTVNPYGNCGWRGYQCCLPV